MVFEYIPDHLEKAINPFRKYISTVQAVNKLTELQDHADGLAEHWASLTYEDRLSERSAYQHERAAIDKYMAVCIGNLAEIVRTDESERVSRLQDDVDALRAKLNRQKSEFNITVNTLQENVRELEQAANYAQNEAAKAAELKSVPYLMFREKFLKFCALPSIGVVSADALNILYKELVHFINFLDENNVPKFVPDHVLLAIIHDKIDVASRVAFSMWTKDKQNPSCAEFIAFLQCRIDNILDCEKEPSTPVIACAQPSTSAGFPTTPIAATPITSNQREKSEQGEAAATWWLSPANKYSRKKCAHCSMHHPIIKCQQFKTATYESRLRTVQTARLCLNCLMSGHRTEECDEGPCHRCKIYHNSIMCKANWDAVHRGPEA